MHNQSEMLFSLTVLPVGSGDDLAGPITETVARIARSGLPHQVTGTCTIVEGRWDQVMPIIESAIHDLSEKHPRVYANVTVDHHRGSTNRLRGSVEEVEQRLGG